MPELDSLCPLSLRFMDSPFSEFRFHPSIAQTSFCHTLPSTGISRFIGNMMWSDLLLPDTATLPYKSRPPHSLGVDNSLSNAPYFAFAYMPEAAPPAGERELTITPPFLLPSSDVVPSRLPPHSLFRGFPSFIHRIRPVHSLHTAPPQGWRVCSFAPAC